MAAKTPPSASSLTDNRHRQPGRGSRRRGPTLQNAILDAAWDELAAVGYARVTMAGVAARAATNKAALYRRWPNRTALLAAAIDRRVPELQADPLDTGNLGEDAIAVLQAITHRCHAARLVPDPGSELARYLRRRAVTDGLEHMNVILDRAAQRGELKTRTLNTQIARLPVNVLHSELCIDDTEISDQLITRIIDELFLPLAQH